MFRFLMFKYQKLNTVRLCSLTLLIKYEAWWIWMKCLNGLLLYFCRTICILSRCINYRLASITIALSCTLVISALWTSLNFFHNFSIFISLVFKHKSALDKVVLCNRNTELSFFWISRNIFIKSYKNSYIHEINTYPLFYYWPQNQQPLLKKPDLIFIQFHVFLGSKYFCDTTRKPKANVRKKVFINLILYHSGLQIFFAYILKNNFRKLPFFKTSNF